MTRTGSADTTESGETASYRKRIYEIRGAADLSVVEKLYQFLEVGTEYLGVENAHLKRVDSEGGKHYIIVSAGQATELAPIGDVHDHATTYCRRALELQSPLAISDAEAEGWGDDPAYLTHDLSCYLGTTISVAGEVFGTLCFVSEAAHSRDFSADERAFVEFLASVIGSELVTEGYGQRLSERDKLLTVLNRVLRHNLRNDMNIIQGNADILLEVLAEEDRHYAEMIEETAQDLVQLGDKARQVEQIVRTRTPPTVTDIVPVLESVTAEVREANPEAAIGLTAPDQFNCVASPHLETALFELVDNAASHAGSEPTIGIEVRDVESADWCIISIEDDGPGISPQEQQILDGTEETQLSHGQGLGLWLAYWAITHSDGYLSSNGTDGTTIRVHLQSATTPEEGASASQLLPTLTSFL